MMFSFNAVIHYVRLSCLITKVYFYKIENIREVFYSILVFNNLVSNKKHDYYFFPSAVKYKYLISK